MSEPPKRRLVRPPTRGSETARATPTRVKGAKLRTQSSRAWLERQLNDPFVAEAKAKGYRSRAAFKLTEIDDRYSVLGRGAKVIDLGCAPGGWVQVAIERGAAAVVGIDLLPVDPAAPAVLFQGDFTDPAWQAKVLDALGGPADVVLSDMAPNTTGHRETDHLRIVALIETATAFAAGALKPGGAFVCKAFQGGETAAVLTVLKTRFAKVRHVKPKASRSESAEVFLVATGFREG